MSEEYAKQDDKEEVEPQSTALVVVEDSSKNRFKASDWQLRHDEIEAERERIRSRVRNTSGDKSVIRPAKPKPTISDTGDKTVGIYARVSTKSTEQTSSIENQTLYYTQKVAEEPQWTLHKIYSDEGKSGTSTKKRFAFNQMMADASNKDIDLILCASVSRFARNMSDCMTWIRQLKSMNPSHPVGVYFETENIYTLDPDSTQRLSIHAMLADWESANKSARMILSYDQRICTGQYPVLDLLGMRHTKDGQLIIEPEEAKTVRYIFLALLLGHNFDDVAEVLTEKERPTLKGRTDWNAGMVRNIINNERRWGDLEARKTIVIDVVEHKTKKNDSERISAYKEGHHKGIVSPEIARAVKMVGASARSHLGGISDIMVIRQGALKGFVSINPQWGGINHDAFMDVCMDVYTNEEIAELEREIRIWSGEESSKILSMQLTGYEVPRGIYFLNSRMPSLTVNRKSIKFSKACMEKLGGCTYVEVLYHPILQAILVRESTAASPNSICWNKDDKMAGAISTRAFSQAIFDNMQWKMDYSFRFRGVTKNRNGKKFIIFALDEPQILPSAKDRKLFEELDEEEKISQSVRYIPYKEDNADADDIVAHRSYPVEWRKGFGLNYGIWRQRNQMVASITDQDIAEPGVITLNPLIGQIPSREEIQYELDELLLSM